MILSELQKALQEWLDVVATLHIDILEMLDMPTPPLTTQTCATSSTQFLLEGEASQLTKLWQLTRPREAPPIISSWEYVGVRPGFQKEYWLLRVILDVAADQWNFLQERELSGEDSEPGAEQS